MRVLSTITLVVLLLMGLFVVDYRTQEDASLENLQQNLTSLRSIDVIFNESFTYKNPYDSNFTFKDFVINTGHVIAYPLILELHTTIGAGTNFMYKYATFEWMKSIWHWLGILFALWLLFKSIKPIGIIYVILSDYFEKKNKKVHPLLIVLMSIIILLFICGIIIGLILLL